MKRMILIMSLFGFAGLAEAQTNRTYRTDMDNERIMQMERQGSRTDVDNTRVKLNTGSYNQETEELIQYQNTIQMNEIQQFQGNRQLTNTGSLLNHPQVGDDGLDYGSNVLENDNAGLNNGEMHLNEVQQFSGNVHREEGTNHTPATITTEMLPYRSVPYDTTKNNGHCLGCGSGSLTDPH